MGWVENSEGNGGGEKESSLLVQRLGHVVAETGPLYLQTKVKLYMSNLAGDMFLWGKA